MHVFDSTIKRISVVVPIYNEERNIPELSSRLHQVLSTMPYAFEVILINDGSSDKSAQAIREMAQIFEEIKGIDLAGNFGQTVALRAGIEFAKGDVIIAMDGDLQHDPNDIPRFMEKMEEGYDLVGGAKEKRPDGWFKSMLSHTAHSFISKLSGVDMSYFGATYKAYRSYLLKSTNLLGDGHRFLGAIVARKGIRYTEIPITIHERIYGTSNYKMNKVWKVLLDLIFLKFFVSYIKKPFRLFGTIGIVMLLVGLFSVLGIVAGNFIFDFNIKEDYLVEFLLGIAVTIIGMLFLSIGAIAEIGVHIYFVQKKISPYTIRTIIQSKKHAKTANS